MSTVTSHNKRRIFILSCRKKSPAALDRYYLPDSTCPEPRKTLGVGLDSLPPSKSKLGLAIHYPPLVKSYLTGDRHFIMLVSKRLHLGIIVALLLHLLRFALIPPSRLDHNFSIFDLLNPLASYNFSTLSCPRLQVTKHLFFRFAYLPITGYRRTPTNATESG